MSVARIAQHSTSCFIIIVTHYYYNFAVLNLSLNPDFLKLNLDFF